MDQPITHCDAALVYLSFSSTENLKFKIKDGQGQATEIEIQLKEGKRINFH